MGSMGDHVKSRRKLLDRISMGHPDWKGGCRIQAKKQIGVVIDGQIGPAEFPMRGGIDGAATLVGEQLHAVTDAQNRDVEVKNMAVYFG